MSGIKRYYEDQPSVQNQTTYSLDYRPSLALTGLSSSLSVIGSLVIFLSFYKDRVRSFTFRILVCLTVADFLNAVGNILGVIRYSRFGSSLVITQPSSCDSDNLCVSQSFITVILLVDVPGGIEPSLALSRKSLFGVSSNMDPLSYRRMGKPS